MKISGSLDLSKKERKIIDCDRERNNYKKERDYVQLGGSNMWGGLWRIHGIWLNRDRGNTMNKDMLEGNWDTQGRASSFVWLLFKVHEQKTVVREIIKQLAHDHSPDYWGMSPKERRQVT